MDVTFSSDKYPEGLSFQIISKHSTGLKFFDIKKLELFKKKDKDELTKNIQILWDTFNLNDEYILVPKNKSLSS